MTTTLTTFEARVSALLEDTLHKVFPVATIDEGIRQALSDYGNLLGVTVNIDGLDGAVTKTLPNLYDAVIVAGAAGYAARSHVVGMTGLAPVGTVVLQAAFNTWAQNQLAAYHKALDQLWQVSQRALSTQPYDTDHSWLFPDESTDTQGGSDNPYKF